MDPRAAQVVLVQVSRLDARHAELIVTAERAGRRSARTLSAPPETIEHAAVALARHYRLVRSGQDAWIAGDVTRAHGGPTADR